MRAPLGAPAARGAVERYLVDDTDLKIQALLRDDGRMAFADIGMAVGLSADAVRTRVGRLVSDGVLRIIGAVHPSTLGYFAIGTAWLSYPGRVSELALRLQRMPNITYMTEVLGPYNVLLEIAGHDDDELARTLQEITDLNPDIRVRDVWRTLEYHKWHSQGRPDEPGPDSSSAIPHDQLSESDIRLLRVLVQNPRASYRELAAEVDESYWNVRRRVQQLFSTHTIRPTAMLDRTATGRAVVGNMGIRLAGDVDSALRTIADMDEVNIVSWQTGMFNTLAEFACRSQEDVGRLSRAIASIPSVTEVQVWPYVRTHIAATPWLLEDSVTR
ncbi:Lrp/AsnC family transcriptional regulator [Herbiconiux moechotypicola]|uniref:Lrp/AsnC family transcriptional regulator n=1 Tax=Herbiconiux moechotypicola TaxID=637393 RepID=A0ABP5QFI1_9MICO|nr:Lrp/AsnC family transcriptional regulator [Herbiconiux moechotypicola]MCS5730004.1 Lrp/AsnC family transcriptional regulator [Herbiconiux moechotypicola]